MKKRLWKGLQKNVPLPVVILLGAMTTAFVITGLNMRAEIGSDRPTSGPPTQQVPGTGVGDPQHNAAPLPSMRPVMRDGATPEGQNGMRSSPNGSVPTTDHQDSSHGQHNDKPPFLMNDKQASSSNTSFGMPPPPPLDMNSSSQSQYSKMMMNHDDPVPHSSQSSSTPPIPQEKNDWAQYWMHVQGSSLSQGDNQTSSEQSTSESSYTDQQSSDDSQQSSESSMLTDQSFSDSSVSAPRAGFEDVVLTSNSSTSNRFYDLSESTPVAAAANFLAEKGVVGGYSDGTFQPKAAINRAETAKFILLAKLGQVPDMSNGGSFKDVLDGQWYTKYVVQAASMGIIAGYPDHTFGPEKEVNTAEFLAMLTRTFNLLESAPSTYDDVPTDAWFAPYAAIAQKYNLLPDRTTSLNPDAPITREEAAIAIATVMQMGTQQ